MLPLPPWLCDRPLRAISVVYGCLAALWLVLAGLSFHNVLRIELAARAGFEHKPLNVRMARALALGSICWVATAVLKVSDPQRNLFMGHPPAFTMLQAAAESFFVLVSLTATAMPTDRDDCRHGLSERFAPLLDGDRARRRRRTAEVMMIGWVASSLIALAVGPASTESLARMRFVCQRFVDRILGGDDRPADVCLSWTSWMRRPEHDLHCRWKERPARGRGRPDALAYISSAQGRPPCSGFRHPFGAVLPRFGILSDIMIAFNSSVGYGGLCLVLNHMRARLPSTKPSVQPSVSQSSSVLINKAKVYPTTSQRRRGIHGVAARQD